MCVFSFPSPFFSIDRSFVSLFHDDPYRSFCQLSPFPRFASYGSFLKGDRPFPVDRFNLDIAIPPSTLRHLGFDRSIAGNLPPFNVSCIGQPFILHLPLRRTPLRNAPLPPNPLVSDVDAIERDSILYARALSFILSTPLALDAASRV